jgi:hypothetical protein
VELQNESEKNKPYKQKRPEVDEEEVRAKNLS